MSSPYFTTDVTETKVSVVSVDESGTRTVVDTLTFNEGDDRDMLVNVWGEGRLDQLESPEDWDLPKTKWTTEGWTGRKDD